MTIEQKKGIQSTIDALNERLKTESYEPTVKAINDHITSLKKQLEQEVDDREPSEVVKDQIASLQQRLIDDHNELTELEKEGVKQHIEDLKKILK